METGIIQGLYRVYIGIKERWKLLFRDLGLKARKELRAQDARGKLGGYYSFFARRGPSKAAKPHHVHLQSEPLSPNPHLQ